MCLSLGCNGIYYDYAGFGVSGRRNWEESDYVNDLEDYLYEESMFMSDIDCMFEYLIHEKGVNPKNIILYGNQIGSYLTLKYGLVELKLKRDISVGGIVLETIFPSILRISNPELFDQDTLNCKNEENKDWVDMVDMFDSWNLIDEINDKSYNYNCNNNNINDKIPLFLIHDKCESICEYSNALKLYDKLENASKIKDGNLSNISTVMKPLWVEGNDLLFSGQQAKLEDDSMVIDRPDLEVYDCVRTMMDDTANLYKSKKGRENCLICAV